MTQDEADSPERTPGATAVTSDGALAPSTTATPLTKGA